MPLRMGSFLKIGTEISRYFVNELMGFRNIYTMLWLRIIFFIVFVTDE